METSSHTSFRFLPYAIDMWREELGLLVMQVARGDF